MTLLPREGIETVLRGAIKVILRMLGCGSASGVMRVCARLSKHTSFLIAIPHSGGTAIGSILFRPLTLVRFRTSCEPGASLFEVGRTGSFDPFASVPCSPFGSTVTLFLTRFLCHTVHRRTRGHPLFTCLRRSVL